MSEEKQQQNHIRFKEVCFNCMTVVHETKLQIATNVFKHLYKGKEGKLSSKLASQQTQKLTGIESTIVEEAINDIFEQNQKQQSATSTTSSSFSKEITTTALPDNLLKLIPSVSTQLKITKIESRSPESISSAINRLAVEEKNINSLTVGPLSKLDDSDKNKDESLISNKLKLQSNKEIITIIAPPLPSVSCIETTELNEIKIEPKSPSSNDKDIIFVSVHDNLQSVNIKIENEEKISVIESTVNFSKNTKTDGRFITYPPSSRLVKNQRVVKKSSNTKEIKEDIMGIEEKLITDLILKKTTAKVQKSNIENVTSEETLKDNNNVIKSGEQNFKITSEIINLPSTSSSSNDIVIQEKACQQTQKLTGIESTIVEKNINDIDQNQKQQSAAAVSTIITSPVSFIETTELNEIKIEPQSPEPDLSSNDKVEHDNLPSLKIKIENEKEISDIESTEPFSRNTKTDGRFITYPPSYKFAKKQRILKISSNTKEIKEEIIGMEEKLITDLILKKVQKSNIENVTSEETLKDNVIKSGEQNFKITSEIIPSTSSSSTNEKDINHLKIIKSKVINDINDLNIVEYNNQLNLPKSPIILNNTNHINENYNNIDEPKMLWEQIKLLNSQNFYTKSSIIFKAGDYLISILRQIIYKYYLDKKRPPHVADILDEYNKIYFKNNNSNSDIYKTNSKRYDQRKKMINNNNYRLLNSIELYDILWQCGNFYIKQQNLLDKYCVIFERRRIIDWRIQYLNNICNLRKNRNKKQFVFYVWFKITYSRSTLWKDVITSLISGNRVSVLTKLNSNVNSFNNLNLLYKKTIAIAYVARDDIGVINNLTYTFEIKDNINKQCSLYMKDFQKWFNKVLKFIKNDNIKNSYIILGDYTPISSKFLTKPNNQWNIDDTNAWLREKGLEIKSELPTETLSSDLMYKYVDNVYNKFNGYIDELSRIYKFHIIYMPPQHHEFNPIEYLYQDFKDYIIECYVNKNYNNMNIVCDISEFIDKCNKKWSKYMDKVKEIEIQYMRSSQIQIDNTLISGRKNTINDLQQQQKRSFTKIVNCPIVEANLCEINKKNKKIIDFNINKKVILDDDDNQINIGASTSKNTSSISTNVESNIKRENIDISDYIIPDETIPNKKIKLEKE